jgi:hypothetical protein
MLAGRVYVMSLIAKYILYVPYKCENLFMKIFWLGALKVRVVLPGASGASGWAEGGGKSPAARAERPFRHRPQKRAGTGPVAAEGGSQVRRGGPRLGGHL